MTSLQIENKILEIIELVQTDELTQSDIQGIVGALVRGIELDFQKELDKLIY